MIINGIEFNSKRLDLNNKFNLKNWHSLEYSFVSELKRDRFLVTKIYDYLAKNLDVIVNEGTYDIDNDLVYDYFKSVLNRGINDKNYSSEELLNNLVIPYPETFLPVIEIVSSLEYPKLLIKSNLTNFDWSEDGLAQRKKFLCEFDNSILPITDKLIEQYLNPVKMNRKVLCWSCGNYKTTVIRQFIVNNFENGVVYACSSKSQALILQYDISSFIGKENTLLVTSLKDSYEDIKSKKVLITTYDMLLNRPCSLLLELNGLPRTYLIIDEQPETFGSIELSSAEMQYIYNLDNKLNVSNAVNNFYLQYSNKDNSITQRSAILNNVEKWSGIKLNRVENNIDNLAFDLSSFVVDKVVNIFRNNPNYEIKYNNKIYFNLDNLNVRNILICDGTGDLLLSTNHKWDIIKDERFKFNFTGSFSEIKSYIQRDVNTKNLSIIENNFKVIINKLIELTHKHDKILVVSWKDLKFTKDNSLRIFNLSSALTVGDLNTYINLELPSGLRDRFEFTYYKSEKTHSTNEFIDCDAIVLLGNVIVDDKELEEFNNQNSTNITSTDYTVSEVVQAIYRTRARDSKSVSVYYTSDWDKSIIQNVMNYINYGSKETQDNDSLQKFCKVYNCNYNSRNVKEVTLLSEYLNDFLNGKSVIFTIEDGENVLSFKSKVQDFLEGILELKYQDLPENKFKVISL